MGGNDLEQVTGTLLPVLQNKYYQSTVKDFVCKIKAALGSDAFTDLLSKIENGQSDIDKMARFLFLEKYNSLREDYAKMLSEFPVLRYRMHYLSEAAKEKKILLSLSEKYKQRVEWHLSRIYRTRNSLVHSGKAPRNIRYLGEHLHFYVDSLMLESFKKLSCGVQFCVVDNALLDSLLACEIMKKQLNNRDVLGEEDISEIINPIFTTQEKFEYVCDCE
jgi:ribosomal protein S20